MCYVNRTATYKEIFQPIESNGAIVYSHLPEHTIAEKIYKIRMIKGSTQYEFAKMCGIGYSSLCKYEIGFKPSLKNLKKICEALDINMNYFF